jgi:aspartyl-tRNA(Asn)/glutamyl-tRNA(Gln) amidotransferase subunit C
MAAIDRATVLHIARLAYLELPRVQDKDGHWVEPAERLIDEAQLDKLAHELGAILDHVRQLDALDLSSVEPTSHGVPLPPLFRSDELGTPLATERALAGAPASSGESFLVPKIIE